MKAISLHEPWATLLMLRKPCLVCRDTRKVGVKNPTDYGTGVEYDQVECPSCPEPVKTIETRSWAPPPSLNGVVFAVHATKALPPAGLVVGDYTVFYDQLGAPMLWFGEPFEDVGEGALHGIPLWPGHIIGTARLDGAWPMQEYHSAGGPYLHVTYPNGPITLVETSTEPQLYVDLTGQLPYGHFEHGRFGWHLTDQRTCWERCPVCLGVDQPTPCVWCLGRGGGQPVPARGFQRVWNWDPASVRLD